MQRPDYRAFLTTVREYLPNLPDMRSGRFLFMLNRRHGQKAVENFMERFIEYGRKAGHQKPSDDKLPFKLLGYEKTLLRELYPAVKEQHKNASCRAIIFGASAATAGIGFLSERKFSENNHWMNFSRHITLGGLLGMLAAAGGHMTDGQQDKAQAEKEVRNFLQDLDSVLSDLAIDRTSFLGKSR